MTRGLIEIRGLGRSFGAHVAVHPIHVSVGPGGITGLLGPNGAGKSTLMRMLIGLVRPDVGSCSVSAEALRGDGTAIRKLATYSPGELAVHKELTALEHLKWFLRGRHGDALGRALELAQRLELPLGQRVQGFSHGMKRMLSVAAAMAPKVDVRILDEPTEGLDPAKRKEMLEIFRADAEQGTTILLSSHHLGEIDLICDRRLFIRNGELLDEQHSNQLHEKGRRALRVEWSQPVEAQVMLAALSAFGEVRLQGQRMTVFLNSSDARPALAALAAIECAPQPDSLSFGQLSLGELYREIYGREGI